MSVPVDMQIIEKIQKADEQLQNMIIKFPAQLQSGKIDNSTSVWLYKAKKDATKYLIDVPAGLADDLLKCFHVNLLHP